MNDIIKEFQKEYRWLSNFAPVLIKLGNYTYPSVEHAYMAEKAPSTLWKQFCADRNNSAGVVKRKSKEIVLASNWDEIKISVMEKCLRQKFNQEPYRTQLLETGNKILQEGNNWGDRFWGISLKDGKGENNLGKLIMKIRAEL